MGQCGLWPQEGSREIRTDVEVYNARFTLVIKERCTVWWGKKENTGRRLLWIMQNGGWAQGHSEPATLFLITVQDTSVVKINDSSNEKDPGIHLGTHFQDGQQVDAGCWLGAWLRARAFGFSPHGPLSVAWASSQHGSWVPGWASQRGQGEWHHFSWPSLKSHTCHFYHILRVKAVTKAHPLSRGQDIDATSWWGVASFWKSIWNGKYSYIHFKKYIINRKVDKADPRNSHKVLSVSHFHMQSISMS